MAFLRAALALLLCLAFLACSDTRVLEPTVERDAAPLRLVLSSASASPGEAVVVRVEPSAEGAGESLHGTLRFDPHRLRYTGGLQERGALLVVNDDGAGEGELDLVVAGLGRTRPIAATLTFEVRASAYAGSVRFESAPPQAGQRVAAIGWSGPAVDPSLLRDADPSRRVTAEEWAGRASFAAVAPSGAPGASPASAPSAAPGNGPLVGDCETDGVIDVFDLLAIARIMTGVHPAPADAGRFQACDVNGDGFIDVFDIGEFARRHFGGSSGDGGGALRVVTGSGLAPGTVGNRYRLALRAVGGGGSAPAWSHTAGRLPPGLGLSAEGVLSGTPTATGTFTFTATVRAGPQQASQGFTLRVEAPFARDPGTPGSGDCPAAAADAVKPDFCEDFRSYRSTAELHSNPHGWLWWRFPHNIRLSTVAPPGQSRSVMYTYRSREHPDKDTPRGRILFAPALGRDNEDFQEIWLEVKLRFSDNFTTEGHPSYRSEPDPPAAGFKLLHTHYYRLEPGFDGPQRFGIAFPNGDGAPLIAQQGGDNWDNQYFRAPGAPTGHRLFDGTTWHVIRQHIRVGPDSRNLPHLMRWWLNGQYQGISRARYPGSGVPYLYAVEFGVNMNRYAPHEQHIWWAHVKIWTRDPGW